MLGKHLVLLIGKIVYIPEQKFYVVELSDGWYSIFFVIFNNAKENSKNVFYSNNNALFLDLIHKKMLFSGLKLHLVGLEKAPYQNLVSFFNFETFESEKIIVNVCYNNVSRAKWNEKLGLKKERFFLKNLNSLRPCGGFVSLIDVFVIKKYPLLEKKGNKISYLRDNSEGTQIKTCIFFKICVIDSLLFESKGNSTSNSSLCQKNYVEIGFFYTSIELYEHIQEGDRLRITNLKAEDRDKVLKKRFDFITNEIVERKVYLEMSKFSKITFYNELKRNSLERKTVSCFGKEISHKMRKSISNICSNNEIVNKFKKEKIENKKLNNELDCMIYVISLDFINKDVITGRDAKNNEIRMKVQIILNNFEELIFTILDT